MKWKLTGRYLMSILLVVMVVVLLNIFILVALLSYERSSIEDVNSNSGEDFTREFERYLTLENGEPRVNQRGVSTLKDFGAWVQFLDTSGRVVSDVGAPKDAPSAYSPIDLIQIYKYMDDDKVLYFVSEFETFTYLIGVPDSKENRQVIMIEPESLIAYFSKAAIMILIVDLIVAALIGLAFSTILTRPVYRLTERISQLKERDFTTVEPKRVGIYRPVFTNLNDVSETLTTYERERAQLETRRKEWMSNVSHDLKTPLASIQGYAELLDDATIDESERRQYAEVIERQAVYMKELLDDFNLTMRLQHGDFPLDRKETNLESFVRELVIDILNDPRFSIYNIEFTSIDAATRQLDHHFMKRALLNFIYNALLHNDDSVTVHVLIEKDEIRIQDDGVGIETTDLPYIFERYYRGTNTNETIGSGLGMAISRDIIEAHGGTVTVTSEREVGTTIHIVLSS